MNGKFLDNRGDILTIKGNCYNWSNWNNNTMISMDKKLKEAFESILKKGDFKRIHIFNDYSKQL